METFDNDLARHQDRGPSEDEINENKINAALDEFIKSVRGITDGPLIDSIYEAIMLNAELDGGDHFARALNMVHEKQRQNWQYEII